MVVTEHEHGDVRGGGELVEPLELVRRDAAAVGAGSGRVEHRERDALELDCEVTGCDLFGDHRVVVAAHVVHAIDRGASTRRRTARTPPRCPRFVRSPFTTTASGSSASISSIAPAFITSGYGSSPGSDAEHRAELLGRPELAALLLAEVDVVHGRDRREELAGRPHERRHRRRQQLRGVDAVDAQLVLGLGLETGDPRRVVRPGRGDRPRRRRSW